MPSYSPFSESAESPRVVPTMLFELELNIEFRKILEGECVSKTANIDRKFTPVCDSDGYTLPSVPSNLHSPTTSTPSTSASSPLSASSPTSTPPWSDNSSNSTSTSSTHSASTPPRPASPKVPPAPHIHTCPTCSHTFRLPGQLNKHWFLKHERRFPCAVHACGKAFNLRADLARHTKSRHAERAGVRCEHTGCAETFSRRDNMMRHVREEHGCGGRRRRVGSR